MATIRLATADDADAVGAIYAPVVEESTTSFEVDSPSVGEMRERIAGTTDRFPWLVCEHGNDVVGYAYAGPHRSRAAYRWSVDVSVYVREDCRGAGVGRGLYESLFELLRLQGFVNAFAGVTLPNPASVALHESLGFEPVGVYREVGYKRGGWHDVRWYRLPLAEHVPDPDPPRDLPDVLGSRGWDAALAAGESSVLL